MISILYKNTAGTRQTPNCFPKLDGRLLADDPMTNDDTVGEAFENQETRWSEIVDDNVTLGVNTTISWEIFRARMK